jgi:hypothetical protein
MYKRERKKARARKRKRRRQTYVVPDVVSSEVSHFERPHGHPEPFGAEHLVQVLRGGRQPVKL